MIAQLGSAVGIRGVAFMSLLGSILRGGCDFPVHVPGRDGGGAMDAAPAVDAASAPDAAAPDAAVVDDFERRKEAFEAWRAFHEEREAVYGRRLAECTNLAVELQAPILEPLLQVSIAPDVRAGLVDVDTTAIASCLDSLRTAPCEAFVRLAEDNAFRGWKLWRLEPFRSCATVVAGKVPRGGVAQSEQHCANPDDSLSGGPSPCENRCQARPMATGVGDECDDQYCPQGTVCWPRENLPGSACAASGEGATCPATLNFCGPGLFCERPQPSTAGSCRSVRAGPPCEGFWQCPVTMACIKSGTEAIGHCAAGKPAGELCEIQGTDLDGRVRSDCAFTLQCLSTRSGEAPRCFGGSHVGEPCGVPPGAVDPDTLRMECLPGSYCDLGTGNAGTCVTAHQATGGPCTSDAECVAPDECRAAPMQDLACFRIYDHVPVGGGCTLVGSDQECVFGSVCNGVPVGAVPAGGRCQAYRKQGETCSVDDACDSWLSCDDGFCRAVCDQQGN